MRLNSLIAAVALGSWSFAAAARPAASSVPASPAEQRATADYVPDLTSLVRPASSELRELVERFVADRNDLERFYSVNGSARQIQHMREFYKAWQDRLGQIPFASLGVEGRVDATLLRARLVYDLQLLDRAEQRNAETASLVPFAADIAGLQESSRYMQPVDGARAAAVVDGMRRQVDELQAALAAGLHAGKPESSANPTAGPMPVAAPAKVIVARAVRRAQELQATYGDWFKHYDGYDPMFSWWVRKPHDGLDEALTGYIKFLREKILGIETGKDEPIVGDPIGRAGLVAELQHEMVPYTPEELLAVAEHEFIWVESEMRRAARDLGYGDDWKAALEKVKLDHVAPGDQPALVRDLALEAIQYVTSKNLVTVPPLAADVWLIRMMSVAQQKEAPFFLGGADILVAYPTENMEEDDKLQSLRANNRHFARATVFHELVPGHHLQSYYYARVNQHRQLFTTPFWVEGWSVWWEMYLYDLKFTSTPEDRIGALFWRAHRCARILFSLNFHLGKWTPQQCIDFLVDRVGHERWTATGEVRRSFNGAWSPLYQAGYLLGAMQIRELHHELVDGGKMTDRVFHDTIVSGGPMPIELVRARLRQEKLPQDFTPSWRWANTPTP